MARAQVKATMQNFDSLFASISELVLRHSPSGAEHAIDAVLRERFAGLGIDVREDASGNLIARIPGTGGGRLALTAHKDEIGAIVTAVEGEGRIRVRKLGGSFPWVYGEGIVDLLGDTATVSGVLSFGSRHVSHASAQHSQQENAPLKWTHAWIETKLRSDELAQAGVRIGTPVVVGAHRKAPFRLANHIASYALDNKASLAILLELARRVREPCPELYLVATSKEEVGAVGALYFTQRQEIDALVALEVSPIAPEYSIQDTAAPVLLVEDGYGLYDEALNRSLRKAAADARIPLQLAVMSGFGSDGSIAMRQGHIPRAACLGFATQNTHGYEIAPLAAIENCVQVLEQLCRVPLPSAR